MVSVSTESEAETEARLLRVISRAHLAVYPRPYAFVEFSTDDFPRAISSEAVAIVRDDEIWSQLVPTTGPDPERFALFSFHFPPDLDNSGFVGWLASRLKHRFGTGVFVTCGYNSKRGGVYDYWGVPLELGPAIVEYVRDLNTQAT